MLPSVLVAILARKKEKTLPYWLELLEKCAYPKDRIFLFVRANNSNDATNAILKKWLDENEHHYCGAFCDFSDFDPKFDAPDVHEWSPERYSALAGIRQQSIEVAKSGGFDFYFVADVDNYILPHTLGHLVSRNVQVVSPMLRLHPTPAECGIAEMYSNFHNVVTDAGYFCPNNAYDPIWHRQVRGLIRCDLVHCTYLIRNDAFSKVSYFDNGSSRHEYVIFSENLRRAGIPQYLDNETTYGVLTLTEDADRCRQFLAPFM